MSVKGMLAYSSMLKQYGGDIGKFYDVPSLKEFKKSNATAKPKLKAGYTRSTARMEGEGVGEMVYSKNPERVITSRGIRNNYPKYGMSSGTYIYEQPEAPDAAPEPTPEPTPEPPVRDDETVQRELAELNTGRDRYDNTRLDRPENNQPRYGFSDDPYRDAIGHGDDLNAHYQNKFIPSLKAEAEQTSREIGFSGRNALNSFIGKVPKLGDPKDLFAYYSDKITETA